MLVIKNFENIKGKLFGDWKIYSFAELEKQYTINASAERKGQNIGVIVKIDKEEQANNEYNVRIYYKEYGNEVYCDNWIKSGFDTMDTFLNNVKLIVNGYESIYKK